MVLGLYALNEMTPQSVSSNFKDKGGGYAAIKHHSNTSNVSSIDIYIKAIKKIENLLLAVKNSASEYHALAGKKSKEGQAS